MDTRYSDPNSGLDNAGGNHRRIMRSPKHWILVAVLIGLIVVSVWLLFCMGHYSAKPLPEVKVAVVEAATTEVYGEYEGSIRARQFVEVRARVEGYLEKMLFKEGSYVSKGQTLFLIDPKIYKAQVDRARAQLSKARAMQEVAERNLERIRPLYNERAASQLDLDNAGAAVTCAKADVAVCEADLLEAQTTLSYTQVVSPISGYISVSMVDVGALVGPSNGTSLLATIVRSDSVMIDFSVTELDYLKSKDRNVDISGESDEEGAGKLPSRVALILADGTEYPYGGVIEFANPQMDSKSGAYSLRAEMPNPDKRLMPGESIKVKMLLDVIEGAITVPSSAVQESSGGSYVYVITSEGIAERRSVTLGPVVGDEVVIESGLRSGEKVALDCFDVLSDGMKVREAMK